MKDTREFWISGFCPYCDKAFSIFTDKPEVSSIYQCYECRRGLTIIAQPLGRVIIEGGTPKQCFGDIMPMPKETRRGNA
jgi:hypothetical protein